MAYQKFCYWNWTDLHGLKSARRNLQRSIQLADEARIPCRVLRASTEVAYLAPPAWNGFREPHGIGSQQRRISS